MLSQLIICEIIIKIVKMDEKFRFDFLEFNLSQIIGKDGSAKTF